MVTSIDDPGAEGLRGQGFKGKTNNKQGLTIFDLGNLKRVPERALREKTLTTKPQRTRSPRRKAKKNKDQCGFTARFAQGAESAK